MLFPHTTPQYLRRRNQNDTICFGGTRHETASSAQTTTQRHHIYMHERLMKTSIDDVDDQNVFIHFIPKTPKSSLNVYNSSPAPPPSASSTKKKHSFWNSCECVFWFRYAPVAHHSVNCSVVDNSRSSLRIQKSRDRCGATYSQHQPPANIIYT